MEEKKKKIEVHTVHTYYEHLYSTASKAVGAVLRDRYSKTGVELFAELNAYSIQKSDKILYNAETTGYNVGMLETELKAVKKAESKVTYRVTKAKKALATATTPEELENAVKVLDFWKSEQRTVREQKKSLTAWIADFKKALAVGYSDRMALIQAGICEMLDFVPADSVADALERLYPKSTASRTAWTEEHDGEPENVQIYILNYKLMFKAMCKGISASMAELANPDTDNTYRNYRVCFGSDTKAKTGDFLTAEQIAEWTARAGGTGKKHKIFARCWGGYRTFYTVEKAKNGKFYKIKHYATTRQYYHISSYQKNTQGESVEIDTYLAKNSKNTVEYDNKIVTAYRADIEYLIDLCEVAKLTAREQEFIKAVLQAFKDGAEETDAMKMGLDALGMVDDKGRATASGRKFVQRLREKLTRARAGESQTAPEGKTKRKCVDLLAWTEKAEESHKEHESVIKWVDSDTAEQMQKAKAERYKALFANSKIG